MNREELAAVMFDELHLCGCGDPQLVVEKIRDVLRLSEPGKWSERNALLGDRERADYWVWLYWLDGAGLLEHGSVCSGSWRTAKADAMLKALEEYGIDPMAWEEGQPRYNGHGL